MTTTIINNDNSNNNNPQKRKYCLMIFTIIICSIIVIIVCTSIKAPIIFTMDQGETRQWIEHSYTFNKKLYIKDFSAEMSIYQLSSNSFPKLIMVPESNIIHIEELSLTPDEYVYYQYYLNKGSIINIDYKSLNGISYYLFQGQNNFDSWVDDPESDNTWKITAYSSNDVKQVSKYTIIEDDTYYIAFDNENYIQSKFQFKYTIDRTAYDLNSFQTICYKQSECDIDLNFNDKRRIYIKAPSSNDLTISKQLNISQNDVNDEYTYNIQISGEPRLDAIISLLLLLPMTCVFMCLHVVKSNNDNRIMNDDDQYNSLSMNNIEDNDYEMSGNNPVLVVATPLVEASAPELEK
jgi:hypothetical protein